MTLSPDVVLLMIMGIGGTAMIGTGLLLWSNSRKTRLINSGKPLHFGIYLVDRLNLGTIIARGDWIMAGFDLTAIACGLISIAFAVKSLRLLRRVLGIDQPVVVFPAAGQTVARL